jgi:nucleoside-diphosphate-sugar epimerase
LPAFVITGATGYLGYHLTTRLLNAGHSVHAIVQPLSDTARLRSLTGDLHVHPIFSDSPRIRQLIGDVRPEVIHHLAAARSGKSAGQDFETVLRVNVLFGVNLAEAVMAAGRGRIVVAGSWWQYDPDGQVSPNNLYGASKQALYDLLRYYSRRHSVPIASLVLYDVYGPGDWRNRLTSLLCRASRGETIAMTPGEQKIELVHIDDVVAAFEIAGQPDFSGAESPFFVGTGTVMSIREIAALFGRIAGKPLALQWGAMAYPSHTVISPCRPTRTLPGWMPRHSIEEGLAQVAASEGLLASQPPGSRDVR